MAEWAECGSGVLQQSAQKVSFQLLVLVLVSSVAYLCGVIRSEGTEPCEVSYGLLVHSCTTIEVMSFEMIKMRFG